MVGAVTWSSIDRFGQQAIQLIIGMILSAPPAKLTIWFAGLVMIFFCSVFCVGQRINFGRRKTRRQRNRLQHNLFFNRFGVRFLYTVLFFFYLFLLQIFFEEPRLTPYL